MTRVIHTGDTHIGYQQYNSPDRRADFLSAFRSVAEDAVADDVDAVVHAGDLFHDRRPGLVDLQGTIDVLRTLEAASIPFLAIVGNHETKRDAQWLDLFADLGLATRLGAEPVTIGDVAFYGLDYVPKSRRDALSYDFAPRPDDADRAVLVAHGLFEPFAHATWDTETVLETSSVDFDAVLLGDNHAADTAEVADTWVTYCGSTERASASERDPRGYNLVTFDDAVSIRRRGISATRDFAFVDVELAEGEGIDRVRERLSQHDLADAVVIVTIEGDGDPVSPAPIEEYATERGALVARANDRRELADEAEEVQVSFADPDTAVTERLRELEPSDGALTIDRTVRDDTIADSNVRETVERHVREALSDDGLAFAELPSLDAESDDATGPPDGGDGPSDDARSADPAPAGDDIGDEREADADRGTTSDSNGRGDATASDDEPEAVDDEASDASPDDPDGESTDESAGSEAETGDARSADVESDSDDESDAEDDQVSIGDFA